MFQNIMSSCSIDVKRLYERSILQGKLNNFKFNSASTFNVFIFILQPFPSYPSISVPESWIGDESACRF